MMGVSVLESSLAVDLHPPVQSRPPDTGLYTDRLRLAVQGVAVEFGGHTILGGVTFEVRAGQIALLCGPNGAGKTTLLNVLSGFLRPHAGAVMLEVDGRCRNILGMSPDRVARLGISRLWQDIRLFPTMTVLENVMAASPHALGMQPLAALIAMRRVRRQEAEFREQAIAWLELLGMADRWNSSGDKLSIGQAKRVAIARMLQCGAQVLLLDEPLAGLDRESVVKLVDDLNRLADTTHKAILVVEHNQDAITSVCDVRLTLRDGALHSDDLPGAEWVS